MKNKIKIKDIAITIIIICIIIYAILSYGWIVKVENGETKCYNLLNQQVSCYP